MCARSAKNREQQRQRNAEAHARGDKLENVHRVEALKPWPSHQIHKPHKSNDEQHHNGR